jgi:hypothetical protein
VHEADRIGDVRIASFISGLQTKHWKCLDTNSETMRATEHLGICEQIAMNGGSQPNRWLDRLVVGRAARA